MRGGIAILDYVFILRPTLFYPIWTFFLAGVWGTRFISGHEDGALISPGLFWIAAGLTALMGSIYILNQIQDAETDRINSKLFLIARGIVPVRAATIEALLLAVVSLGFGFWVDYRVGMGFLFLFLLGLLYSYPPARWKNRPYLSLISNGLLAVVCYSVGWMAGGGERFLQPHMAGYFLAGAAVYLNTTLPDIDGDRRTGKITFAVRHGLRSTLCWALVLEVLAIAIAGFCRDWLLLVASVAVCPLFFLSVLQRSVPAAVRATKMSVVVLTAVVCVFFLLTLIPVFAVFLLSRWYYKKRFDLDYPNFKST